MPAFPMFIDLTDKKVVVFGGGLVALRKIRTLLMFHPLIDVYAKSPTEELIHMCLDEGVCVKHPIECRDELYRVISDAFIVICATDDENFNHDIALICKECGVFVNSATSANDCSFIFPSVTVRENIVCGMTSSGNTPVLTKKIREIVDAAIPEWYATLSKRLCDIRNMIKATVSSQKTRQRILKRLADYGLAHQGMIPDEIVSMEIQKAEEVL